MMSVEPEILRRDLGALAAGLEAVGVDLESLGRAAGFGGRVDRTPPVELGEDAFGRLLGTAVALSGDRALPLAVGDAVPFGAYEIVDYLASSCGSVGAGLHQVVRYFRLITPNVSWMVEEANDPPLVSLTSHHLEPAVAQISEQYTIGVTFGRFHRLTGGQFAFASLDLAMPAPSDPARHRAFFGTAPVRYDAPNTVLRIPRRVWELPLERHEPGLRRLLERHAETLLARELQDDDPLSALRSAIRSRLSEGDMKIDVVSRELGTSARTLQRRLAEAGTTFQGVVDEERRRAAQSYLKQPRLAVGDVAYMVGYSEPSAFVRAFKRWTGVTPRAFRQAAHPF